MKQMFSGLSFREEAASSVEYAILASLIALVIVSAVGLLGFNLRSLFQLVADHYPK
jgi:Flp pilus assembly pilin Flp